MKHNIIFLNEGNVYQNSNNYQYPSNYLRIYCQFQSCFSSIVAQTDKNIVAELFSAFMNRLKLEISRADLSVSLLYSSFTYQLIPSINLFGVVPRDGCLSHRHLNSDYFGGNICRRSAVCLSHGSGREEADPAKRSE